MTRVAVVDLGTNSTRLLVADVERGFAHEVERRLTITKLGQNVDAGRKLVPEASERVLACLADYCTTIEGYRVDDALAYATSAVRDAINGSAFLQEIESRFGLPTRLLSGEEEALLTFTGVSQGRELTEQTLIVDLGGGSTEIIVGDASGVVFHSSVPIGCIRLTERFLAGDPATVDELDVLVRYVRGLLEDEIPEHLTPTHAIGTAGTVTTLGTLHLGLAEEDPEALHRHRLPAEWISQEAALLSAASVAQRARWRGIAPERAPVIAAGATAIAEIVGFFGLEELEISEYDVLHGVALELSYSRS